MALVAPLRLSALMAAVAVLVAGRVPGDAPWSLLAVIGGVLAVAVAAWSMHPRAPVGTRSAALVLGLGVLLVPTSGQAWLGQLSAVTVGILFVLALHVFFTSPDGAAPKVGPATGRRWYHGLPRALPAILATSALLASPWLAARILPARIHAAYELQTALEPLAFLAAMASVLLFGALLWTSLDATARAEAKPASRGGRTAAAGEVTGGDA